MTCPKIWRPEAEREPGRPACARKVEYQSVVKEVKSMKKGGLLNPDLNYTLATLGHTDGLCICDAGLPIPEEVNRIDLTLVRGVPGFLETLEAILPELEVEEAILAEEIKEASAGLHAEIRKLLGDIPVKYLPHSQFKQRVFEVKGVVRTAEFTPYANIILVSGVKSLFAPEDK